MRVVIVNPVWDARAPTADSLLDRYATLTGWASAVKAAAADIAVVVCQRTGRATAPLDRDDVRYVFCRDSGRPSPGRSARIASEMRRAVQDARPDVVHVNGIVFPELIRSIRRAIGPDVAIVVQDHGGFDPAAASPFARLWIRRGLSAADAVLAASSEQAAEYARLSGGRAYDVMESSTSLRPRPRDTARTRSRLSGDPALLWLGRLNDNKDPLTVLEGAAQFFRQAARAELTMVFQSSELLSAVALAIASAPALANRVHLWGALPHDDLADLYSAADAFVIGSRREGSGYAAIEALACGALPVVTDIPPFRALTRNGEFGELWTPGRPDALVAALQRAMSRGESDRRTRIDWFNRAFSWPAIGVRAVDIYRRVLNARRRAS